MKIPEENITGKIKELYLKYNLQFFYTDNFAQALRYLKQIEVNCKNSIAVDIETTGLDIVNDDMLGIVIAFSTKKSLYINIRNWKYDNVVKLIEKINTLPSKIIMHNMHFDCSFTGFKYKIPLRCDFDTMIFAYCLYTDLVYNEVGIGLKELTRIFLPYGDYEIDLIMFKKDYCKKNKIKLGSFSYGLIPDSMLSTYGNMDGICTLLLFNIFMKKKKEFIDSGWIKLESLIELKHKVTYIYTKSKIQGYKIDRKEVKELYNRWKNTHEEMYKQLYSMPEIKKSEKIIKRKILIDAQTKRKSKLPLSRCRKLWKESVFNFWSNNHLRILFYEVLNLKVIKKTDTGEPSTDSEVLEYYAEKGVEFMKILNEYSTYVKGCDGFLGVEGDKGLWNLSSDTHTYVHSNFNHCGTVSSRTSTTSPNISQVPSKGVLKEIKKCYVVGEGYKLNGFDYASAEMYIASAVSQEKNYLEVIEKGLDFHSINALNAFENRMVEMPKGLSREDKLKYIKENYTNTWRFYAKCLGFSLLYGTTEHGLSHTLGTTKKEAKEIIDLFLNTNTGIRDYIDNTKKDVYRDGYVENFAGQRVYLPECKKYNPFKYNLVKNRKALANYRFAINFKVQSANAFILYEALILLDSKLQELNWDVRILATIYDAVYFEVNKNIDSVEFTKLIKECFEVTFLGLKMKIEVSESDTGRWYDWENIKL